MYRHLFFSLFLLAGALVLPSARAQTGPGPAIGPRTPTAPAAPLHAPRYAEPAVAATRLASPSPAHHDPAIAVLRGDAPARRDDRPYRAHRVRH